MSPTELALEIRPRARLDITDVRSRAGAVYGPALDAYPRCLYYSPHTTAGYLPQSLAARLQARPSGLGPYLNLFRAVFPERAGYLHDSLDLRNDLAPAQRETEPINADSHLAYMGAGLHACASYTTRRPGPVFLIDFDGVNGDEPRRRVTRLVGYSHEVVVARTSLQVPVSAHPIEAVNLKDGRLGLFDQLGRFIDEHGVTKGRVRLELAPSENFASLTVNEYETLLMRHDLAEVLRNPIRFAAQKARSAWDDPMSVPGKAMGYAKYDLVHALNQLVEALGLSASRIEGILARALEVPASRFLRMKRSVDLLVSDAGTPGKGAVVEGTFQAPIMVQWRPATRGAREVHVALTRFE